MIYVDQVRENGYAVLPSVVPEGLLAQLTAALDKALAQEDSVHRRGASQAFAMRNVLLRVPEVAAAADGPLLEYPRRVLGKTAHAVRGIYFDKTPDANWKTGWHQDHTVPIAAQKAVPGFSGWSEKDGVLHADVPASVMDCMLAVRVHLDDCGPDNAPLQVLPGSHRFGRIEHDAEELRGTEPATLTVLRGDIILMKPLLLHSSMPARISLHRRVIHIEYAVGELPGGLKWGRS